MPCQPLSSYITPLIYKGVLWSYSGCWRAFVCVHVWFLHLGGQDASEAVCDHFGGNVPFVSHSPLPTLE